MIYRISTTGITGLVVLRDLGDRLLVHPTVDIDLGLEYSECELVESHDLQAAIDNGKILVIEKSDYALTLPDVITVASGVAESEIADHAYSKTDLNAGQLDTRYYTETEINTISGTFDKEITEIEESLTLTSGSIIKNHGGLSGLSNDDHPQYHTDARGDIRYYDKITVYNMITSASGSIIKAHSGLTGLSNDDHPQYHTDARGDVKYYSKTAVDNLITSTSGSIIKAHSGLTGLSNDDHPQYHTDARGDAKYYSKTVVDNLVTSTSGSIIKNHGGLTGLGNDDHTHYILSNGTRAFTSTVLGVTPTQPEHLATKGYVDSLPSGQFSIFGSEYRFMVSEGESNTNSTSPIIKLTLTANNLVGGTYRIGWYYEWRRSGTSNSYVADVIVDDCTVIMNHYAAPKLTTDYLPSSGFGIVNLDTDNHTISLRYCASNSNYTSYIKKARIEIWRVQ